MTPFNAVCQKHANRSVKVILEVVARVGIIIGINEMVSTKHLTFRFVGSKLDVVVCCRLQQTRED